MLQESKRLLRIFKFVQTQFWLLKPTNISEDQHLFHILYTLPEWIWTPVPEYEHQIEYEHLTKYVHLTKYEHQLTE